MALFVDLDDDDGDRPPDGRPRWEREPVKTSARVAALPLRASTGREEAQKPSVRENPNRNSMTEAFGCYPIIVEIASSIDLNALDNLSRTCRQVRESLLQYRTMLLVSTLHCTNEDMPVDPEEVLRYRARAGNWFYMEDQSRTGYTGKTGHCARDMVSGCRRCGLVVCRNCAIKPPAPIVLRDRYRRLCLPCMQAPLGRLVRPRLPDNTPLDAEAMQQAICRCDSDGVWLCQPCGRTIRGDDHEYQTIWKWRNQYGEVLGGLGTGIGEGDRGAICGRNDQCCAAKEREQETDCDAEDAREAQLDLSWLLPPTPSTSGSGRPPPPPPQPTAAATPLAQGWIVAASGLAQSATPPPPLPRTPDSLLTPPASTSGGGRTPSPSLLGPGYARHEIEGIGGKLKTKRVKMVRVGACVPEWEDEKARGEVLGREVRGQLRSWCGWCRRVIPGKKDHERSQAQRPSNRDSTCSTSSSGDDSIARYAGAWC